MPMNHQMSFDFPPEGLPEPGLLARVVRKRSVPKRPDSAQVSPQLSFRTSGVPVKLPAPVVPRIASPAVVPKNSASGTGAPGGDGRRWCEGGWTARVIRNESDDDWAVEILRDGEPEPVLLVPWRAGRDEQGPALLDQAAFAALVKSAADILQRHQRQVHTRLHKRLTVSLQGCQWELRLDIVPDEYEPHALLTAFDESGEQFAQERVRPDFTLTEAVAQAWIEGDFRHPGESPGD